MKKLISLFLTVMLLLAMFGGCTSDEPAVEESAPAEVSEEAALIPEEEPAERESAETEPSEPVEEVEESAEALEYPVTMELPLTEEPVSLSFWYSGFPNWDFETVFGQNPAVLRAEELTGVHADINFVVMDAFAEKFNLMIASGEYPDFISSGAYVGGYAQAYEDEVIIDITDIAEEHALNYMALLNQNELTLKAAYSDDSRMYGFASINKEAALPADGPIIRQDWLDKLDLDSPVTYADYENVLETFKTELGVTEPFAINRTGVELGLLAGFDTAMGFYAKNGVVTSGYVADEMKEYIVMIKDWYERGLISPEFITNPESRPDEDVILSGNCGMWINGYQLVDYEKKASDPDYKLAGIPMPVKNEGGLIHTDYQASVLDGNQFFCVTTACADPELAVKWMDFWYSEDGYYLCNYGVEDLTYNLVDGEPVMTELMTDNPDGLDVRATVMYFTVQFNIPYYKDANNLNTAYTEAENNARKIWASNQDGAWVIPSAAVLNTDESADYALHITDIETYADENLLKFITGERPLDEWDEYVSVFYELGIEECMAAKQSSYDRFMAR